MKDSLFELAFNFKQTESMIKRVITVLALFSIGFFAAFLFTNTTCLAVCSLEYPKQVYCIITEYVTPGHTYCTTTINNREYKYLHHSCDSSDISTWNPGTNANSSGVTTRLGVCQVYSNYTYRVLTDPAPNFCFSCNTNYFAFLYRMFIL